MSENTTPPTFGSSKSFNVSPLSYRISVTDSDTNGSSNSPKDSSGSIHPNTGPAQMSKLSSRKIEGSPTRHPLRTDTQNKNGCDRQQ